MSENLFLGDTTYPHLPDAEDQPVLVIDAAGNPVLNVCGDVKAPADYSFECVNNFVHCEDPKYEELQYLALGMATRIAQLEAELAEARKVISVVDSLVTAKGRYHTAQWYQKMVTALDEYKVSVRSSNE